MKLFFKILSLVAVFSLNAAGQGTPADSMKQLLQKAPKDTNRVKLLQRIAGSYYFTKPDSCLVYALLGRELAKELKWTDAEIFCLNNAGEALRFLGDYPGSLKLQFDALKISQEYKKLRGEADCLGFIGFTYVDFGQYRQGLYYLIPSAALNLQLSLKLKYTFDISNIGNAYDLMKLPDSALYYQLKAIESYSGLTHGPLKGLIFNRLGNAYAHNGQEDSALVFYNRAIENCHLVNDNVNLSKAQGNIASLYYDQEKYDSSLSYARLAFINSNLSTQRLEVLETSTLLSKLHRIFNYPDSTLFYQDIAMAMKDSLYGPQKFKQLQLFTLGEQQRQHEIEKSQEQYRNQIKYIILFIILSVFLLISFLLLKSNRQKQRDKLKIQEAYTKLKDTQQQLIQHEKMASLGELTAGISHEIQNPLNFVNNFSELNQELILEMQTEMEKGNILDAKLIANNIKENEIKIHQHGHRAAGIVKGMLQHSQKSSGAKEPTDLNALADEYLRLAYHSYTSKGKNLPEIKLITDFDPELGLVNIIPQDIGRVLLNLYNNAFWACVERGKAEIPLVKVTTKKFSDKVELKVIDNGPGIPPEIIDKIFQPFFTTKPTGQGTGLGLSLAYDIIKAHEGTIEVKTPYRPSSVSLNSVSISEPGEIEVLAKVGNDHLNESIGQGSEFIIQLPITILIQSAKKNNNS